MNGNREAGFSGHLGVDDWPPSSQSIDLPKGQASLCTVDTESISRAQTRVSSVAGLCDVSNTYLITGLTRLTQDSAVVKLSREQVAGLSGLSVTQWVALWVEAVPQICQTSDRIQVKHVKHMICVSSGQTYVWIMCKMNSCEKWRNAAKRGETPSWLASPKAYEATDQFVRKFLISFQKGVFWSLLIPWLQPTQKRRCRWSSWRQSRREVPHSWETTLAKLVWWAANIKASLMRFVPF